MPWEALRWLLAEATGWTLEYIDALDLTEILEWFATKQGRSVASK